MSKKIGAAVYDVYVKTSADIVAFGETTVAATLTKLSGDITDITKANGTIDTKVKAASDELYNKIMGITDEDGTTVNEAYDTLKEVAAYIASHGSVAAGFADDIAALKTTVGDSTSGLVKDLADLKADVEALDYSKVTASTTNGNIIVDGTELNVYTLPETLPASMITESDTRKFVTADQISAFEGPTTVKVVDSVPANASENDLYFIKISE